MKNPYSPKKFYEYIGKHTKIELLVGGLVFAAGIIIASFGVSGFFTTLNQWFSTDPSTFTHNSIWGMALNDMIAKLVLSLILILPSFPIFLVAYLLIESHNLGVKFSILSAIGILAIAFVGISNFELTFISGYLCFLAGTLAFIMQRDKRRDIRLPVVTENAAKFVLRILGLIGIAILAAIVIYIAARGIEYVSWDFITGADWRWTNAGNVLAGRTSESMGGISHFIIGSLLLVLVCEAVALPLGLGAAIYLAEYTSENKLTNTIRFFIETLAGIPSIVLGLVGFGIFCMVLNMGRGLLAGGLALALMILPWNIRVTEEAIKSVPQSYREASYALGATKSQTIGRMILYAASPAIITGILLGVGAAIGETAVLMWTAGSAEAESLPSNFFGDRINIMPMPCLSVWIFAAWNQMTSAGVSQWQKESLSLAGATVLIVIFLSISIVALLFRNYLAKKINGK